MQSNKSKLIFIVILAVLLFSCSKEVKEPAEQKTLTESKTAEDMAKETLIMHQDKKVILSGGYIETENPEFDRYKGWDIRYQESDFVIACERNAGQDGYKNAEEIAISTINEYPGMEILKIDSENKEIIAKQIKKSCTGKREVTYNAVYKYFDEPKTFAYIKCELEKPNIKAPKKAVKRQVHGEITESQDDPDKDAHIKLFENYINMHRPFHKYEDDKKPYEVLDYIKGNFTNSGKDEYIVCLTQGTKIDDFSGDTYKESDAACCFILENKKILKVYKLPAIFGSQFFPTDTNNLGYNFFHGWIADFNQNGINEIFFLCNYLYSSQLIAIEFNGELFKNYHISSFVIKDLKVDWDNRIIKIKHNTDYVILNTESEYYIQTVQWNEEDNCYWAISDILQPK